MEVDEKEKAERKRERERKLNTRLQDKRRGGKKWPEA